MSRPTYPKGQRYAPNQMVTAQIGEYYHPVRIVKLDEHGIYVRPPRKSNIKIGRDELIFIFWEFVI